MSQMKILVTGSRGQLGTRVVELLSSERGVRLAATDRSSVDVTRPDQVSAFVKGFQPDWIVNCAAYTDVEKAEIEPEKAYLVNDAAVGHLADAAQEVGARLLHVSTDYVFSGDFGGKPTRPYTEEDPCAPLNQYGSSKRAGEVRLSRHAARSVVLRTSWLFGGPGKNFLHTMLRVGAEARKAGKAVRVVSDQIGTPTDAWSLAKQVQRVLSSDLTGVVHASSHGETSWFGFAKEIYRVAGIAVTAEPIRSVDYPTKALRPPYSVLDNRRLRFAGIDVLPDWVEGLQRAWSKINAQA